MSVREQEITPIYPNTKSFLNFFKIQMSSISDYPIKEKKNYQIRTSLYKVMRGHT